VEAALQLISSQETLAPSSDGYRVLARKYRPIKLSELIGQDFLVETLKRAIEGNRLGHAFILTGIRGTGKTTTARIMARALNCEKGPTPEPCGVCSSCTAIAQDRSMDVIEIDAASRTSVDDIREIIEASRYKAVSSRYKVYIIDEIHMLSKSAFNALLKTLEEPPSHVKFIFATTEINKVPTTILSRCVRFDLKRIKSSTLATYFKTVCDQENVSYEDEALALMAKAAEGSVRDGLSLLDQAISYGSSTQDAPLVTAVHVRQMLGLSDQGVLLEFFHTLMEGDTVKALEKIRYFYQEGADPLRILEDLMDLTHWFHCLKINPTLAEDLTLSPEKRQKGIELVGSLSIPTLTRFWQILLKGFEEVKRAPSSHKALEVIVIRLTHLAPLPSVHELLGRDSEELLKKKVLSEASTKTDQNSGMSNHPGLLPASQSRGRNDDGGEVITSRNEERGESTVSSNSSLQALEEGAAIQESQISINQDRHCEQSEVIREPLNSSNDEGKPENTSVFSSFEEFVAWVSDMREGILHGHLLYDVHLVDFSPPILKVRLSSKAPKDLPLRLQNLLKTKRNEAWTIAISDEIGQPTLQEKEQKAQEERREAVLQEPLLKTLMEAFPGTTLMSIEDA